MAQDAVSDLDAIDPELPRIKLRNGLEVEVQRLRTRQFFRLLKILTHGAGPALVQGGLDFNAEGADFGRRLFSLVVMSIPDAEQETIDFVQSMVEPVGAPKKAYRDMNKAERETFDSLYGELARELYNPELDDMITVIETVVRQEAPEIQELGKRLASLLELAQKTGQLATGSPEAAPSPAEMAQARAESEGTPPPSTSSAPSTGGQTSASSGSRSAGSARSRRPSQPGGKPTSTTASG